MTSPPPVLIDCDPGHDDAIALLLAHASPLLTVRAVTTVAGNQTLDKTTLNARRVAGAVGMDVVIAAGCDRPMVRALRTAAAVHGDTGMDGPVFTTEPAPLDPRHGVDVIVETVQAEPGGISIAALGPLTNLAVALRLRPSIAAQIREICLMGGAWGLGNQTPAAEFNMFVDPEAAKVVLDSGIPIKMVGLELTRQAAVTDVVFSRIGGLGTIASDLVVSLLDFYRRAFRERHGYDGAPLHDPCAVAWLINPELVTSRPMQVVVETVGEYSEGRTVCDVEGVLGNAANVRVGIELDARGFWDLLSDALATYPLSSHRRTGSQ